MISKNSDAVTSKNTSETLNVIGIGASAGGLEAIQKLFNNIPENTGHAFVVIQHLSPDYKSLMPELLASHTKMQIFTAEDKQEIKPNCIYLNQNKKNLHVKDNRIYQLDKGPRTNLNLPIDIFFHTLGEEFKENAIGIILSGTGTDGSRGINTIKEQGGLIFVQEPESASFDGMPYAAIETGLADFTMTPEKIGDFISQYSGKKLHQILKEEAENATGIYSQILKELEKHLGIDFSKYKNNTLYRRLEKRININQVKSPSEYYELLKTSQAELHLLHQDFLISVTSFFRELDAFATLKKNVLPILCKNQKNDTPLRIWVPGCATGEEAYSIAMSLDEYISDNRLDIDFKIYATDIHIENLGKAKNGLYKLNAKDQIGEKYLSEYFLESGKDIRVIKRLRDKISFVTNNILKDPPFVRVDLISCRNLLIYLEASAQESVLKNFALSLNTDGFLFLGHSENIGHNKEVFKVINSRWKIFQRKPKNGNTQPKEFSKQSLDIQKYISNLSGGKFEYENEELTYYKLLAQRYSPSIVIVDSDFDIQFIKGDINKKLNLQDGVFHKNIIHLVNDELATIIRNGIRQTIAMNTPVAAKDIIIDSEPPIKFDLGFYKLDIESKKEQFVIEFSEDHKVEGGVEEIKQTYIDNIASQRIAELEYELNLRNNELSGLIEELETNNEELQASNEELTASNEELNTTNEELQSINEELQIVNTEYQEKNIEISTLQNDLNNLYESQEIATIFLDKELKIRFYTPHIQRILKLTENDYGRPIEGFAFLENEDRNTVLSEATKALETGSKFEKEIKTDHKFYLLRIYPLKQQNSIKGVNITFIDINDLVEAQDELNKEKRFKDSITESPVSGIYIYDFKLGSNTYINKGYESILGYSNEELSAMDQAEFAKLFHPEDFESIVEHMEGIVKNKQQTSISYRFLHKKGHWVHCYSTDAPYELDDEGNVCSFIGAFVDITQEKKAQQELEIVNSRLNLSIELEGLAIWEWDIVNDRIINFNENWQKMFGMPSENVTPAFRQILDERDAEAAFEDFNDRIAKRSNEPYIQRFRIWNENRTKQKWIKNTSRIVAFSPDGQPLHLMSVSSDITYEREVSKAIEIANQRLELSVDLGELALWEWDIPSNQIISFNQNFKKIFEMIPKNAIEDFMSRIHKDDAEDTITQLNNHVHNQTESYDKLFKFWNKDFSNYKWITSKGKVIERADDGTANRLLGISRDVTTYYEILNQLEEEKKFKDTITDSAIVGIYIFDLTQRKGSYFNKGCGEITGFGLEELYQMSEEEFGQRFHPDDVASILLHEEELIKEKLPKSIKYRFKHKSGHYINLYSNDVPYTMDDKGNLKSFIAAFTDISPLVQQEANLIEARNQAIEASNQKDIFISNFSHEIRTPLTSILGFSKLLIKEKLSKNDKEEYLSQLESNSRLLMSIVNDLLDISKLEQGLLTIKKEKIQIDHLLDSILITHQSRLKEKNRNQLISLKKPDNHKNSLSIFTDPIRLTQALNNLITNAIKFTPKGNIEVGYQMVDRNYIKIWVKDEGIGIKKDHQELIFERFSQVGEKLSLQMGGIGLGLSIVKNLISALGGTIGLNSTYGKGSTFSITIPISEEQNSQIEAHVHKKVTTDQVKKLLIADDSASIQFYYKKLLDSADLELLQAYNGQQAVDLFKKHKDIDLVLMDLRMPVMDGVSAMKEIREFNSTTPIIAQSAFAQEEQIEKFSDMGFDDYYTKPIKEEDLFALISPNK